jgi:hypothetical protein
VKGCAVMGGIFVLFFALLLVIWQFEDDDPISDTEDQEFVSAENVADQRHESRRAEGKESADRESTAPQPKDRKKIESNKKSQQKNEEPTQSVVEADVEISAGGQVDFHGWSVDFRDAFRSQRNGDETPQSGHTFLTIPYEIKNEAPSTRDDPMSSLVVFVEGGRKYENRNATGRSAHAATVSADESTVQWQTFELPKSVVESAFYVAFEEGNEEYPFKMKVYPDDVKNP